MMKLTDNPPIMPPGVDSIASLTEDWWVAHTKSRCEKAFAWDLHTEGIPYFLPMVERDVVWSKKRRKVMAPLFTSYVFFCGDGTDRYKAMATDRLCQVIPVRDRDRFVAELVATERALASGLPIELFPFAAPGRRCRVIDGPLKGVEGKIVQRDNVTRLILEISVLGQGTAFVIPADKLEPID
jgi:hypothetical protein